MLVGRFGIVGMWVKFGLVLVIMLIVKFGNFFVFLIVWVD